MAKAKGLARPAAKTGGDSKQGLVITIVILSLMTIGFAVGTYYGFAGQKEFDDKRAEADKKAKSMEADRNWYKYQALLERAYIFGTLPKSEEGDLPVLRDQAGSLGQGSAGQDEINKLLKALDDRLGWDPNSKKVKTSFMDLVTKLQTDLNNTLNEKNNLLRQHEETVARLNSQRATDQKAIADRQRQLDELNAKYVELEKTRSKEFVALVATNDELQKTIDDLNKKINQMKEDFDKERNKLKIDIADGQLRMQKILDNPESIKPKDMLAFEAPRGKIINLDRKGEHAFINLGSFDHMQPQLTFSVFGPSYATDKAKEKTRKARVEVVDIIGPHLSRARVLDVTDPKRDPVVSGDLLFNPSWSPTLKQHIAIAGLIDLTGDGTDNTDEFVRNLEKQNIAIDAVLDLKTMEMRGRMGFKTTYLVLGDIPAYEAGDPLKETDPRTARKREVAEKLSAIQADAIRHGISIIPAQRFMALIGYRVPKVVAPPDYLIRGPRPLPKAAENGEGAKKPEAEPAKKEEIKDLKDLKDLKEKPSPDAGKEKKIG